MGSSNGLSVWKFYFWSKSKHITIPDQSYYNLPEKKLWRISKNWTIVTLFCCVLQQTWRQFGPGVWCLFINISGHGKCGRKRKKPSRFCLIKREYSNKLYELGFLLSNQLASQKLSFGQHQAPWCSNQEKKIIKNASVYEQFQIF